MHFLKVFINEKHFWNARPQENPNYLMIRVKITPVIVYSEYSKVKEINIQIPIFI